MSDPPGEEIPYSFRDENPLTEALEAAGASLRPEGNKRLALIGDAVLRLIICVYGYTQGWSTGQTSDYQVNIGRNTNLTDVGFRRGLERRIRPNPAQNRVQVRLMATTVEALIGAVYIDSEMDFAVTRQFVIDLGLLPDLPQ